LPVLEPSLIWLPRPEYRFLRTPLLGSSDVHHPIEELDALNCVVQKLSTDLHWNGHLYYANFGSVLYGLSEAQYTMLPNGNNTQLVNACKTFVTNVVDRHQPPPSLKGLRHALAIYYRTGGASGGPNTSPEHIVAGFLLLQLPTDVKEGNLRILDHHTFPNQAPELEDTFHIQQILRRIRLEYQLQMAHSLSDDSDRKGHMKAEQVVWQGHIEIDISSNASNRDRLLHDAQWEHQEGTKFIWTGVPPYLV
jgi:hypothetical protein